MRPPPWPGWWGFPKVCVSLLTGGLCHLGAALLSGSRKSCDLEHTDGGAEPISQH